MAEKQLISPEMTIGDILSKFPSHSQKLTQAMTATGLHCSSCSAATWETLEAGVLGHGMSRETLDSLVKKLNDIINEEIDLSTITLTERAAKKFIEILEEEGKPNYALRFGHTAGGCGGFEYILDFSEKPNSDDQVFQCHGVAVHVKQALLSRLLGSVIDYVDGLQGAGFKVSNPNAKSSCGCGKSQGY